MIQVRRAGAVAALVLAALVCVLGLTRGLDFAEPACAHRFRDDAYLTFCWARGIVDGAGPVVSAGTTTSGVQPLWGLLLALCGTVGGVAAIPTLAHLLGLLLHAATAVLWAGAARSAVAGGAVGLLYLGNPFLLAEAQNGQETALACLLLALVWRARKCGTVAFAVLGLLLVFARNDLWGVVLLLSLARSGWRGLGVPLLVLAAHLGWNRWLGAGWLPDSGLPIPWLHWATRSGFGEPGFWAQTWWQLRPVLLGNAWAAVGFAPVGFAVAALARPAVPRWIARSGWVLVAAAAVAGASDLETACVAAVLLALWPRAASRRVQLDLLAVFVGLGAMLLLHYVLRAHPRDHYLAPLGAVAALGLLAFRRLPLALCAAALAQGAHATVHRGEPLGAQREMGWCGIHAGRFVPEGEPMACFNSGIVAWLHRGAVHNLDGVVDGRAFAALRSNSLGSHLDALGVRFVADHPVQFSLDRSLPHACGQLFGQGFDPQRDLVEVARFDDRQGDAGRPGTDSFRIWWRRGHGPSPVVPGPAHLGVQPDGSHLVLWPAQAGAVLVSEQADGTRHTVLVSREATTWVVPVRPDELGTGRLFVGDAGTPLLVVPR